MMLHRHFEKATASERMTTLADLTPKPLAVEEPKRAGEQAEADESTKKRRGRPKKTAD